MPIGNLNNTQAPYGMRSPDTLTPGPLSQNAPWNTTASLKKVTNVGTTLAAAATAAKQGSHTAGLRYLSERTLIAAKELITNVLSGSEQMHPALTDFARNGIWDGQIGDMIPQLLPKIVGFNISLQMDGIQHYFSINSNSVNPVPGSMNNLPPFMHQSMRLLRLKNERLENGTTHYNLISRADELVEVPKDGNCLFECVSRGLAEYGVNRSARQLRDASVFYLYNNPLVLGHVYDKEQR